MSIKAVTRTQPDTSAPFKPGEYFRGVRQEWGKITWPSRPQVVAETIIVILVVTIFSLFIFVVDKLFQFVIQWIT